MRSRRSCWRGSSSTTSARSTRFSTARWSRSLGLLVLVALLSGFGCVTRGTHEQVLQERDRLRAEARALRERVQRLAASNESLSTERVRIIEEVEDLRVERGELERGVAKLQRERAGLETSLREREETLAARATEMARLGETYQALVTDLEQEVATGRIRIQELREGLRLHLADEILFASGSARLSAEGQAVLRKVASRLVGLPHTVEVLGHTDDRPLQPNARFPSNWELAGGRASRVVRLLAEAGIAPGRLRAVSLGEHHPVAPNDTPEERARNRRIEIRLLPHAAEAVSEAKPGSGAQPE